MYIPPLSEKYKKTRFSGMQEDVDALASDRIKGNGRICDCKDINMLCAKSVKRDHNRGI
jgi:hypothetical protein